MSELVLVLHNVNCVITSTTLYR